MKDKKSYKIFFVACLLLLSVSYMQMSAQVYIISGDMFERSSFTLKASIVDSITNEPIAFASVYIHHPKDTIITNFTLSDGDGNVQLKSVTKGDYIFVVEYLGYKPYKKQIYLRREEDLGTIKLNVDEQMLDASVVSAAGQQVQYLKDTIVYNATMFKTLSNDNLAALLKKMPGFEIDDQGNVKVNGQSISQITINGKTFFMGDKSAALNNLPAKMVDKIKIIDKESDEAQFTGIKEAEKNKVMDVELKEEYRKGVFGNVKVAGGTDIPSKDQGEYIEKQGFLYNASTMVSAYTEKDQVTVLANGKNVNNGDDVVIFYGSSDNNGLVVMPNSGIHQSYQAGVNMNTDRIKKYSTTLSVMYSNDSYKSLSRSDRTTFMEQSDDILSWNKNEQNGTADALKVNFELRNTDRKKYTLSFTPGFSFGNNLARGESQSETSQSDEVQNGSEGLTGKEDSQFSTSGFLIFGLKDMGKKGRAFTITANGSYGKTKGTSFEKSVTYFAEKENYTKELNYLDSLSNYIVGGKLQYTEPISDNWNVQLTAQSSFSVREKSQDAFNADGSANDYYSAISDSKYLSNNGSLLVQYNKDKNNIQFGAQVRTYENVIYTKSFGVDVTTGKDEWYINWAPFLRYRTGYKNMFFNASYDANTSRPSTERTLPILNLTNPTRITLGNIYLRPGFTQLISFSMSGMTKNKASMNILLSGNLNQRAISTASWFDGDRINYAIPVNIKKPSSSVSLYSSFSIPLAKSGKWRMNLSAGSTFNSTTSYQSKSAHAGLDADAFDYSVFMKEFWGDKTGDMFYSGKSGFVESSTIRFSYNAGAYLSWSLDKLNLRCGTFFRNAISRYSVDPNANTNLWNVAYSLSAEYITAHDFELSTSCNYNTYYGYGKDFDRNNCKWDAKVARSIKAFTFGLTVNNILNQVDDLNRSNTVTENYIQNSWNNTMGRVVLLSVSYNFGKANAAKRRSASNASIGMVF